MSAREPEQGPALLLRSGGTALRPLCRTLKLHTHNSIHLITPFDSGGSSARLREAFGMLSIGDLRNRLMALADETAHGNPEIYRLFAYRLPKSSDQALLRRSVASAADGTHPLVVDVPEPLRQHVRACMERFTSAMPDDFDLRGASVGNLVLAGGYLENGRDIEAVIELFSRLVAVRGSVRPTTEASLHLVAVLENGTRVVGQHLITGKACAPITSPIAGLELVSNLTDGEAAEASLDDGLVELVDQADVVCFPMGSFWTSVVANLLVRGLGAAIANKSCPKVYIPNVGEDPEQFGMSIADCLRALHFYVARDTERDAPLSECVDLVLVDSKRGDYCGRLDLGELEKLGLQVLDTQLVSDQRRRLFDPALLSEALLSLA